MSKGITGITGKVKFFNATKGYGFITRDDGQPDVFVHINKLGNLRAGLRSGESPLQENAEVKFDIGMSERTGKPEAINVEVIG